VKRAIVVGIVAWAALWPFAHRALVGAFGVNPWKLGGWAMYTTATPPVLALVLVPAEGKLTALAESELAPGERAALRRFRAERHALGLLREPDDVARAVFAERPELRFVTVQVQQTRLDPETARMRATRWPYIYERRADGSLTATPPPR
jgi:hypothetical protein